MVTLFSVLILAGCANDPYKIDSVATANAPWKVGEIIDDQYDCLAEEWCHQVFLGMLADNRALVQVFYPNGNNLQIPLQQS